MNYEEYRLEDFLMDEEFIRWVKRPDEHSKLFWEEWLKCHPEQKNCILQAREIILSVKFEKPIPQRGESSEVLTKIFKNVNSSARKSNSDRGIVHINWKRFARIAASITLVISVSFLVWNIHLEQSDLSLTETSNLPSKMVTIDNPGLSRIKILLPDSTVVWLNANSRIIYPDQFSDTVRAVEITGQAFFQVYRNIHKPFIAKSGDLLTTVLGTSFSINNYPDDDYQKVSLLTGEVTVNNLNDISRNVISLKPGEQALKRRTSDDMQKRTFEYNAEIGWKDGILHFENANFVEIKKTLERWYGVTIVAKNAPLTGWRYHGSFHNQSLEVVLKRLSFSKEFSFTINDKEVFMDFT